MRGFFILIENTDGSMKVYEIQMALPYYYQKKEVVNDDFFADG